MLGPYSRSRTDPEHGDDSQGLAQWLLAHWGSWLWLCRAVCSLTRSSFLSCTEREFVRDKWVGHKLRAPEQAARKQIEFSVQTNSETSPWWLLLRDTSKAPCIHNAAAAALGKKSLNTLHE